MLSKMDDTFQKKLKKLLQCNTSFEWINGKEIDVVKRSHYHKEC